MKKKPKVVHLTTVHNPHDPRIYYKQCLSLAKANFDTYLIAQPASPPLADEDGVTHIQLKKYSSRVKRMLFGTWEAYKKAKRLKADIYVFHDPELMFVAAMLKNKHNRVIYDIHEDYVTSMLQKEYLPKPVRFLFSKLYRLVERITTRKMDLSLAEKYYVQFYPQGKMILNYPLLNERFTRIDRTTKPIVDKVLYTGNVTVERGALIHSRIPKIAPDITVQFVGKCASSLADEMKSIAGKQKDKLQFEGIDQFVLKEKIEDYYVEENWLAGIALFPPTDHYMKKELTKFFEYMNAGLPIICSNFPTWKEFIEKYQCGIAVDPYDDEQIKNAIETLRNNPDYARTLGENGRRAVINELNWKKEESKLLVWYNEMLQKTNKP
ncbi:MAG TPA: glycosyltransferase [Pseudogracilibacillus sp.]|nr:glycosyltransferase [Pseudogracilibacillus sp.]